MHEFRALLFTDVADSTKLSEQLGDRAMAALWARHDRAARDLLALHDGLEIDKTDGFLLLFERTSDAIAYVGAYHQAIGALDPPLQARAGLHFAQVILTPNAAEDVARGAKPIEVDGIAKPTAARVMSIALAGQTLLTPEALEDLTAPTVRVESHGHWRIKGLVQPIELFEVGHDGAPFTAPPDRAKAYRVIRETDLWLPLKQVAHSLPRERDAFVGRQNDLRAISARLDEGAGLVSVLGIGGTGKTRLVTRYGWTSLGDHPGGVWFCDLTEARGVDGILASVASALGVPLGKDDPVVQLGHVLAARGRCLVILDNFEQVADHADQTVARWLDRAADARFVVTTREVLGLPGEVVVDLAPLPLAEAVELFAARAHAARHDFQADDRASIEGLVQLLDCLPLAIELAAARVRIMPPRTLLARMSRRFELLTSAGGRPARHATLRGALDWSWDLLSDDEQAALAQLSVFEGGFGLEAAEAVLLLSELWPVDAVQALVDKSLVRRGAADRFSMLSTVQEYATERLESLGLGSGAAQRHGAWFAAYGTDEAIDELDGFQGQGRRAAAKTDLDNLVVACRRAVARGDGDVASACARAAAFVLRLQGPIAAAVELSRTVVEMPDVPAPARLTVQLGLADSLRESGRSGEAGAAYQQALDEARRLQNRSVEGHALMGLASLDDLGGQMTDAEAGFEQALELHREVGNRRGEGHALGRLGFAALERGQYDLARSLMERGLAIARQIGDRRREGSELCNLGTVEGRQGRYDQAAAFFEQSFEVHREVGARVRQAVVRGNMGSIAALLGRADEALGHFHAALALHREVGGRVGEGNVLGNLGALHAQNGRLDEALAYHTLALAAHRDTGNRRAEGISLGNIAAVCRDQGRPDEARLNIAAALALHREVGNKAFEGLALGQLAEIDLDEGRTEQAVASVHAGEAILREIGQHFGIGVLMCRRARLEHAVGDVDAAQATLREVEVLMTSLEMAPDSVLGVVVAETRALFR